MLETQGQAARALEQTGDIIRERELQRHRDTETQRHRDTEAQRDRDKQTETKRDT